MPSHAFLGAGASYSCHLAEDAYSAVARAGARWNCAAHNLSPDSAQGGIPAHQGWNSTPSRLACAPCMGGTSERSNAPVVIATPHLKCSTFLKVAYRQERRTFQVRSCYDDGGIASFRSAAHARSARKAGRSAIPTLVSWYSTLGGIWGYIVRNTIPSRSSSRNC